MLEASDIIADALSDDALDRMKYIGAEHIQGTREWLEAIYSLPKEPAKTYTDIFSTGFCDRCGQRLDCGCPICSMPSDQRQRLISSSIV